MGEVAFERQKGARQALLSIVCANALMTASMTVLSPLKTQIQEDLRCTDAQTALPVFATQLSSLIAAAFAGAFVSQVGVSRRVVLAMASATVSLSTCFTANAPNIWRLCLLRIFVGAGNAFFGVIVPSVLMDFYPAADLSYVFALYQVSGLVGGASSYAFGAVIAQVASWKAAVLTVGGPSLIAAFGLQAMREPAQGVHDAVAGGEEVSLLEKYHHVLIKRHFWVILAASVMNTFAESAGAEWFPTLLQRYSGQSLQAAGVECAVAGTIGGLIGSIIGAKAVRHLPQSVRNIELCVPAVATLIAIWASAAQLKFSIYNPFLIVLLAAAYMSAFAINTVSLAVLMTRIFPSRQLSLAVSIQAFCTSGLGTAIAPVVVGRLSDQLHSLKSALQVPLAVQMTAGVLLLISSRLLSDTSASSDHKEDHGHASLLSLFTTENELEHDGHLPEQKSYGSVEAPRP